jgi:hypothetical protein
LTTGIWLREGSPEAEPGFHAWGLDHLGFATWAPTEREVLDRVPDKLREYQAWLARHGLGAAPADGGIEVVERVRGDEILFTPDRQPADVDTIDRALRLLECSRRDLLADVQDLRDEVLDWDPPYARFAPWASWRSIRQILAHVANGESHYYTRAIGYESPSAPAEPSGDWRRFLSRSRGEAVAFLEALRSSPDRARTRPVDMGLGMLEDWSVRKALRRMVRHELVHWKSIRRIIRAAAALR